MGQRGKPIPVKLKQDAIVEAIFEVRFSTPDRVVPEILLGRLADQPQWSGFQHRQLGAAQVPAQIRRENPVLRYQPVIELVPTEGDRAVRIGSEVISFHRLRRYPGWDKFRPELMEVVEALFGKAPPGLKVERLGFRYLNALRSDAHTIKSILDLDLTLEVAGENVSGEINLNFTVSLSRDTECAVRIATPGIVQGDLPPTTSVYVDVDVFTKENFATRDKKFVEAWIDSAHTWEKEQFFRLIPQPTIDLLKER